MKEYSKEENVHHNYFPNKRQNASEELRCAWVCVQYFSYDFALPSIESSTYD